MTGTDLEQATRVAPGDDGRYVADVLAATRAAPSATVAPQPDQAVLDAIVAALEPAAA